jgi:hypothetical protein
MINLEVNLENNEGEFSKVWGSTYDVQLPATEGTD